MRVENSEMRFLRALAGRVHKGETKYLHLILARVKRRTESSRKSMLIVWRSSELLNCYGLEMEFRYLRKIWTDQLVCGSNGPVMVSTMTLTIMMKCRNSGSLYLSCFLCTEFIAWFVAGLAAVAKCIVWKWFFCVLRKTVSKFIWSRRTEIISVNWKTDCVATAYMHRHGVGGGGYSMCDRFLTGTQPTSHYLSLS